MDFYEITAYSLCPLNGVLNLKKKTVFPVFVISPISFELES